MTTTESVLETAGAIREIITDKPLLFTFRSVARKRRRTGAPGRYISL
ncbi:hypothetical protein KCP77_15845 [Salmonella enterica subsp. enterica]|nr:hypothetical protein KCP77_15845 [Salmonella enterica subsp. enterica]